jgi:uncharacterized protein YndB with AHSA1/START domain
MAESRFLYVTYIRAPAQTIWDALTDPVQNRKFWGGYHQETSWAAGADYSIVGPDGQPWDTGKVVAIDPPKRLSVTWLHLRDQALRAEGESTATFELETAPTGITKLTVTHTIGVANSKFIAAVSTGWPMICASLKSLMETGEALG